MTLCIFDDRPCSHFQNRLNMILIDKQKHSNVRERPKCNLLPYLPVSVAPKHKPLQNSFGLHAVIILVLLPAILHIPLIVRVLLPKLPETQLLRQQLPTPAWNCETVYLFRVHYDWDRRCGRKSRRSDRLNIFG